MGESHFQRDIQLTSGNCHSSGVGTPVTRLMSLGSLPIKALPAWESWRVSPVSSHRWLDLLGLQGFRDSGLEGWAGNGEVKEVSKMPS